MKLWIGESAASARLRLVMVSRPDTDTQLISLAYDVAAYWHQGQKRKSGHPYITHPLAVAAIAARAGADDLTLCAALLHDVAEDTPYTLAALRGRFGAEIADLVGAAMRLDAEQIAAAYADGAEAAALAADERVLLLKLADRLQPSPWAAGRPRLPWSRPPSPSLPPRCGSCTAMTAPHGSPG